MTDFGKKTGDMKKSTYDTDEDGVVDDSEATAAHASKHENEGNDEISVAGLSGKLADEQNAGDIKGVPVDNTDIGDQKSIVYDLASETHVYITPAPSGATIKSIQQLEITIDAGETVEAVTISEVVMANTVLLWGGFRVPVDTSNTYPRVELTNTTTVTANRGPDTSYNCYITVTVVEFETGGIESIQRGTITIEGAAYENTTTILEVDTTKAVVLYLGALSDTAGNSAICRVTLTDSTTVTAARPATGATTVVGFEVWGLL